MKDFLEANSYAVVGATNRQEKYGYKIYKFLLKHGKKVYPVHPALKEIEGNLCYKSLKELPEIVEVVDVVVPPKVTEKVVEDCFELGIKKIWMQPGAESNKAIEYCKDRDIDVVANACIMVHL